MYRIETMKHIVPIFLDFEGVLRPAMHSGSFICAANLLHPLDRAEELGLDPYLIIASTYRLEYDWRALAGMLEREAPGLGRRIQGATPYASKFATDDEMESAGRAVRLLETREWLRRCKQPIGEHWIAIDDSPSLYETSGSLPSQLIVCDGQSGFDGQKANELEARFEAISAKLRQGLSPR